MPKPIPRSAQTLALPLRKTVLALVAASTLSGAMAAETQNAVDTTWLSLEE